LAFPVGEKAVGEQNSLIGTLISLLLFCREFAGKSLIALSEFTQKSQIEAALGKIPCNFPC
jgi:hypothetical protein